ncbi:MAG: cytochrome C oxidase subunit IV family protein [Pseudomonas sp.]|uniref:cytochrome C oxidase subunit IV family protein n=1 Tax=Pseudomonas sp. TaxID=306 RepID=UPI002732E64E|nr:cytochrome C oxidase subunit IV family protein [Pseudomonas sp.]MDP3844989.1 cytochrome C oxidase subunit IV family protein [Pseudomonas sp.]
MVTSRVLILCWLGLVALSVSSVQLGNAGAGLLLAAAVLLAALGKAWLIADGFMHLRHAPPLWRGLLLGWPLVVGGVVLGTLCAI